MEFMKCLIVIEYLFTSTISANNTTIFKLKDNKMKALLKEFNDMKRLPIIEIDREDLGITDYEDRYEVFDIEADEVGLHCKNITIEWDDIFSLDEHLQEMYDMLLNKHTI